MFWKLCLLLALLFPSSLALSAIPTSDTSIALSWDPVIPEPQKYLIYREGRLVGFSLDEHFTDYLLKPETAYHYGLSALYEIEADERGRVNTNLRNETALGEVSATTASYQHPELVNPWEDLQYLGAFRLPRESGNSNWHYSGSGLTFYPQGDAANTDAFPGSLYGTGHNQQFPSLSEVSIPLPKITRILQNLPTATTLKPFTFVGLHDPGQNPGGDVAYLPAQGNQQADMLYFSWMSTYVFWKVKVFGWVNLGLTNPQGTWFLGDKDEKPEREYGKYLFVAPDDWVFGNVPGKRMMTGYFPVGGGWGLGPSLFAFEPTIDGQAPPDEYELPFTTLLHYGPYRDEDHYPKSLSAFHKADRWPGAIWVRSGERDAVVLSGTKARGLTWYGFLDGTVYSGRAFDEDNTIYRGKGDKGNQATLTEGMLLFYDPEEFEEVVAGTMESWEPQPYAAFSVQDVLYRQSGLQNEPKRVGASAYDEENGYLYVMEPMADTSEGPYSFKTIVHVWKVNLPGEEVPPPEEEEELPPEDDGPQEDEPTDEDVPNEHEEPVVQPHEEKVKVLEEKRTSSGRFSTSTYTAPLDPAPPVKETSFSEEEPEVIPPLSAALSEPFPGILFLAVMAALLLVIILVLFASRR